MPEIGNENVEALGNFLNLGFPICEVDVTTPVIHPGICMHSVRGDRKQSAELSIMQTWDTKNMLEPGFVPHSDTVWGSQRALCRFSVLFGFTDE